MKKVTNKTLVLSSEDVQEIVRKKGLDEVMDALIERLTAAVSSFNPDKTDIPARSGFNYESPKVGLIEWMPLYNKGKDVVIKVVGYHPENPAKEGLPTIVSTVSSYDTSTGHLKGIIDGVLPTALRTGASSALASRLLARPDASILGLIGCGAQSITQLHALSRVFNIKKVLIYDIDENTIKSFDTRRLSFLPDVDIVAASIGDILENSDIICTATSIDVGAGPLFNGQATKPHLHINAVGSDFPGKIEIPVEHLRKSFVCPDFLSQAVIEGECQQLQKHEIGADWVVISKTPSQYKHVKDKLSVFDSTGWALEDQVVMDLFLEYAQELELGQYIQIESMSEDAKNPYAFLQAMPEEILVLKEIIYNQKKD